MRFFYKLVLCVSALLITSAVWAQTGNISGVVTRDTGATVASATVEIENTSTGAKVQAVTDGAGRFRFENIPNGRYRITVAGTTGQEVTVESDQPQTVNITLRGTGAVAAVDVQATTLPIDTTTPQINYSFNTRFIEYLPQASFIGQNGEAFGAYNLSLLNPGVANSRGIGVARGPVVGGQRPWSNNFYVDGVDNNNRALPGPLVYVPNDATSEFVAFQNQFPPEWGHTAGGQFNSVVRTGTNQAHGSFYDYLQNRNLNAVDRSFARQGITDLPRYDQNRLGGNVGFPIIKNKLFMFGEFEYIPLGISNAFMNPVYGPTAAGYSSLAGTPGISATNLGVLRNVLPAASAQTGTTTVNGVSVPIGLVANTGKSWQNQYVGVGSLDWNISSSDSVRARYVHNKLDANNNGALLPSFYTPLASTSLMASVAEYHNLGAHGVNELRLGYNRFDRTSDQSGLRFPGLDVFPTIQIEQDLNLQLGPNPLAIQSAQLNTYQISDNVNWNWNRHTFRLGYDGRRYIGPLSLSQLGAGNYAYSNLSGFLLDQAPDISGQRSFGNLSYNGNHWDNYLYVNDSWQVRSNLNINLGLKYQFVTIPNTQSLQGLNSVADVPGLLTFHSPEAQKTAFAPLVGLAWSPAGGQRNTVFRAGFGMNYDTTYTALNAPTVPPGTVTSYLTNSITYFPGFFGTGAFLTPRVVDVFNPSVTPAEARSLTTTYIPDQKLPYSMQWNANLQHTVFGRFIVNLGYLGVRGVHLPVQTGLNNASGVSSTQNLPLYYSRPSQAVLNASPVTLASLQQPQVNNPYYAAGFTSPITSVANDGNSIYQGLTAEATQRFSGGFQMRLAYTWSHLIDDLSGPTLASTSLNFLESRATRGTSIYDRRQRATATALWDVGGLGSHATYNWVRDALANINIAGTYTYESEPSVFINSGLDASLAGGNVASGVFVNPNGIAGTGSGVSPLRNSFGQVVGYLANNPNAQYIQAGLGTFPTGGRPLLALRPINNFDVSAVKRFSVRDRFSFELRGDAYNVLNHPQFTTGSIGNLGNMATGSSVLSTRNLAVPGATGFGSVESLLPSNARTLQVSLKLMF